MRPLLRNFLCLAGLLPVSLANAQDNFPDVPKGHWAYKEVAELRREGLLKGYPDGLFRGNRPASRYELAVAVHAAWAKQRQQLDGISDSVLDELKRRETPKTRIDIRNLKAAVSEARSQTDLSRQDIDSLQKLLKELEPELKDLRTEIDKAKVASLKQRVGALEKGRSGG